MHAFLRLAEFLSKVAFKACISSLGTEPKALVLLAPYVYECFCMHESESESVCVFIAVKGIAPDLFVGLPH